MTGEPFALKQDTGIDIDADGNIICCNQDGVFKVTNTGLAGGASAWRKVLWKPTRSCRRLCSAATNEAVVCVLQIAARLDALWNAANHADAGTAADGCDDAGAVISVGGDTAADGSGADGIDAAGDVRLPLDMWHHILSMAQMWELGRQGKST